jgi:two-component system chemotaxis response regulator CheY
LFGPKLSKGSALERNAGEPEQAAPQHARGAAMNTPTSTPILFVEDFNIMARILLTFLRQLGFQNVDQASDGATALCKLRARPYGLLIPDWNIRPMSGFDLVRSVRADAQLKNTRVLMLMPAAGNPIGGDGGADWRLPKPFDAAMLESALLSVFSRTPERPVGTA